MILCNRLMRCTPQVSRYIVHNSNYMATTRQFSGLLWAQLDQSPCSDLKDTSYTNNDDSSTLYGYLNYTRTRSLHSPAPTMSHYCCEETDIDQVKYQLRSNITYPWIAHR